ncbi:MAG: LysR family transcriptional regulator, partial [Firmicutes bacterium]|nr:LysR family transcriptional regulator [Bacillota bacterium]
MDLKTMEYYLAVVREGSITAAAEALHLSQPALSRKMKDLEDELGVVLFRRGNRKVTLTDEGIILRRRADEMIRLMAQTERDIEGAR